MKLYNAGTTKLMVTDILVDGYPLEWEPGETLILYDEDVERSAQIKALVTAATLTVTGEEEPNEGLEMPIKDDVNKIATFEYNLAVASPQRPTTAYAYLFNVTDGGSTAGAMSGGAATKTYAIGVSVNRSVATAATGDSNDAVLKGSYSNYAANDTNFIMRGINMAITNRAGGVAQLNNLISVQQKTGGTSGSVIGLSVGAENYGTVTGGVFGGLDVDVRNEGAVATTEFGIRVKNTNNSLATAVGSAIKVENTGANVGFTVGLNLEGATLVKEIALSTGTYITASGTTIVFQNGVKTATMDLTAGTLVFA